ncbi:glycosyltransferase family 28 domain-containing protein [Phlyctema vagabunda]|uniref:Glycosyltransferase family 28 domain-containing protein n=1 Tax=Phlyctema vagabunda TaxID=108571 RepID=A0ABR4PCK8_9HELO
MAIDHSSHENHLPVPPLAQSRNKITRSASIEEARPALSKWQTERPQFTTKSSLLSPRLARGFTNTSALNQAIWNAPADSDDSDSSSSSSDDEQETQNKKDGKGRGGNKAGSFSRFNVGNENYKTKGKVSKRDGRLNISVNETKNRGYLANALGASVLKPLVGTSPESAINKSPDLSRASTTSTLDSDLPRPRLNIVVMVIGSRGDIQPFLRIGKDLQEYGHRVRIATHPAFREFVEVDSGLEFFSVGGDPAELMAFMVKNPGMIPTMETVRKGEIGRRREQMAEMFDGFWKSCINASDGVHDVQNRKMMADKHPFIADAIIANPPSFAHIHCAERLGIPLHLMFTFPYTPTQAFPHPLANIKKTNVDPGYTNFMSYPLVEMMTWQGLGDLVNNFRVKTLGLEPVSTIWSVGQIYRLKVPITYAMSPGLVPKPSDWGPEVSIGGFVFLDLASTFKPPEDLQAFLDAGDPPLYIGFGSIVVDDPDKFTTMIFEAVKMAGVRALVSKGWGGLGEDNVPENIYMLDNTPHDWLFPRVTAVVHHGGAGTTAIGLKCGKPTMVVPFFGDQQFWGSMIGKAGAGPDPVPYKDLTPEKLAEGIKYCLTDEAREAVGKIAQDIEAEGDGAKNAVKSFHRSLVLRGKGSMRCSILEDRCAVWILKRTDLRLSALAAEILVEKKKITWKQLRLIRHNEWNDFEGPGEPVSGVATALMSTVAGAAAGVGSVPFRLAKSSKRRANLVKRKKRKEEKAEAKRLSKGLDSTEASEAQDLSLNNTQVDGVAEKDHAQPNGKVVGTTPSGDAPDDNVTNGNPSKGTTSAKQKTRITSGHGLGKHTTSGEPLSPQHEVDESATDNDSILSRNPEEHIAGEVAQDVGLGIGQTAEAIARAPMDLSIAVAQGFHNAPRLYGDTTVRRPTRITGIQSGLKAAGEEFAYGMYDGVAGVVKQPYTGARDHGAVGFVKGTGMGLTGLVLKPIAAILGPFGYTMKGVHKEIVKNKQPTHFIRKARILQGQRDMRGISPDEKKETVKLVLHGWTVLHDVWDLMDQRKTHGFRGRVRVLKDRSVWRTNGFENVEMAERALAAAKRGESLDEIIAQQRAEEEKAHLPVQDITKDIEARKPRGGNHAGPGEN